MVISFDAYTDPDDITTFVRNIPGDSTLQFLAEFPRFDSDDNTIDFGEIIKTNRTARYRSFDGRVHVSERSGGSSKRVRLIPLSSSLSMGELERLQLEFARNKGTNYNLIASAAYNDAEQLTREVQSRLEQAWGDVLTDGKLTINENGYAGETDYGLAELGNLVAAGTAWGHQTGGAYDAPVLTDIETWNDSYRATNGFSAGRMKMSQSRIRFVLKNAEVITALYGSNAGRTRATLAEVNELLADEGLPTIDPAYDSSVDVDGVVTRVVPDNKVLFLPQDLKQLGYTAWGVTATALELLSDERSDLTFEDAPGIVGVVTKVGPPFREFVYVDAVAMPVLTNARRLMVATV